ncbi:MAG: acyltransferase [Comamonadaceae bacterium]|nr:MAG: acyltransferase [Comamonadaceae bacterium]
MNSAVFSSASPLVKSQAESSARLQWLQASRGIAALLVLMFHMRPVINGAPLLAPSAAWWNYGFCGVDIFFVISGFVVTRSVQQVPRSLGTGFGFLAKRFLRIFSGYWPALALMVVVTMQLPGNESFPPLNNALDSIFLLSPKLHDHWLGTAWSLSYELYFYICLFVLFFVVPWGTFYQRLVWVIFGLIVFNGAWFVLHRELVIGGAQPMRYLLTGFALEFLAGACVAETCKKGLIIPKKVAPLCLIFAVLGLLLGTFSNHFANIEILRAGSFGVFGLGLVLVALTLDSHRYRAPRWLVQLGDSSFSLYLLHPLLITLFGWAQFNFVSVGPAFLTALTLAAPAIIVFVCHAWYLAVERPLHRYTEQVLNSVVSGRAVNAH